MNALAQTTIDRTAPERVFGEVKAWTDVESLAALGPGPEHVVCREFQPLWTTDIGSPLPVRGRPATETAPHDAPPPEPSPEDQLHGTLISYVGLSKDWDGRGAVPPTFEAVLDSLALAMMRPKDICLPYPQISSDGEVGLYWHSESVFAEIGMSGDGKYTYYARATSADGTIDEYGRDDCDLSSGWPEDLLLVLNKLEL